MCEVVCPKNAITLTINDRPENPSVVYGAFPQLIQSTIFEEDAFDWSRKDFVIANCPTEVIRYDETRDTLVVDDEHCIRCRQCEIASDGAFRVVQPWQGKAELRRDRCVEGCLACADICPTRALHVDGEGELALADYYCIKCGACMQVCPIQPDYEEYQEPIDSQGIHKVVVRRRIANVNDLAVWVERWRVGHTPVQSAAWISALTHMADDKASVVEIDRARALRRRDLLRALVGGSALLNIEYQEREESDAV
jgi:ferredoxin